MTFWGVVPVVHGYERLQSVKEAACKFREKAGGKTGGEEVMSEGQRDIF